MRKIPPPESQIQEVLYELINRISIDRKIMMLSCQVLNLTAIISKLRYKGLSITSNKVSTKNKYGRDIEYVQYILNEKKEAINTYLEMKENQSLILSENE